MCSIILNKPKIIANDRFLSMIKSESDAAWQALRSVTMC